MLIQKSGKSIYFGPPIKSPFLARGLGPRAGPAGLARPGPGWRSKSPARPGPKISARARSYTSPTSPTFFHAIVVMYQNLARIRKVYESLLFSLELLSLPSCASLTTTFRHWRKTTTNLETSQPTLKSQLKGLRSWSSPDLSSTSKMGLFGFGGSSSGDTSGASGSSSSSGLDLSG